MKEKYEGYLIKCDGCGEYLDSDYGAIIVPEDEISETCDAYDWEHHGDTHYCDHCKNNEE
jgi:hypothetical protein